MLVIFWCQRGRLSALELMDWESGVHHTELAFQDPATSGSRL